MNGEKPCSDTSINDTGVVCNNCKKYVNELYDTIDNIADENFDTYVPYINSVTNHWYRNVYFTAGAMKQAGEENFVKTDKEYEQSTGERWTLYETYSGKMGETKSSDYKLYLYVKGNDGQYKNEFEKDNGEYILCKKVENGEKGSYKLSDDGVTYVPDEKGDYKLVLDKDDYPDYNKKIDEFRVGKKAQTEKIASNWTAYSNDPKLSDGEWKPVKAKEGSDVEKFTKDIGNSGVTIETALKMLTVEQVEDGVRGETNPVVKKLFLDDYYLYDGSKSRAALIQKAKESVREYSENNLDDEKIKKQAEEDEVSEEVVRGAILKTAKGLADDPDTYKEMVKEGLLPKKIKTKYDGKTYEATIDQISGPISLNHNSLTAFSILENMHTLDAEYIYHDFKELIVELNYFDKEDLVEAEEEVMMFPVAGVSGAGWPVVRYDKSEDFYGTLIHSAEDLEAKRGETEAEIAEQFGLDAAVDTIDDDTASPNTESKGSSDGLFSSEQCQDGSCNRIVRANGIEYKQFAQGDYTALNNDGHSIKEGGCGICSTAGLLTGYGFDVDPNKIVTKKTELNLKWYPDNGQRADNIQKIFKSYGIEGEWKKPSGLEEIKKVLHDALDNGIPVIIREAPGGSIWHTNGGHYFGVVGQDSDGKLYTVDSATKSDISRLVNDGGIDALANDINGHLLMIFVPKEAPDGTKKTDEGSSTEPEFAGFAGSTEEAPEYVVAPVTGEVVKYGTVNRKNLENGKDNEVGFIKIRVLGSEECKAGSKKGCTRFGGTHTSVSAGEGKRYSKGELTASDWLEDKYSEKKLEKLGYDYFWSEYNSAGIGDHYLYLEGFDVSEVFEKMNKEIDSDNSVKGGNIKVLADYIASEDTQNSYSTQYTVPNLLDDTREFELQVEEEAKKAAAYTITETTKEDGKDVEKIYIKEGAVIGKTFSSDNKKITKEEDVEVLKKKQNEDNDEVETKKKQYNIGNYMKIIFRDTDDEVVENVEDFVETGSNGGENNAIIGEDYDTRANEGTCSVTKEEFKKIFADWSKIVEHTEDFFEMQEKYNVSAVFAAAVCIQEQGGGTANTSHVQNNNWFSQTKDGDYSYSARRQNMGRI